MQNSSRHFFLAFVCSAAVAPACWALQMGQPPTLTPEGQKRVVDRQIRANVAKGYTDAHKKALSGSLSSLNGTCTWLIGLQDKENALKIVAEMDAADAANIYSAGLKKNIDAIAKTQYFDEPHTKELASRLKSARKIKLDGLLGLARTCYDANLLGYAFDLIGEMLATDPDDQVGHMALGEIKVGANWHTPFAAAQIHSGKSYVLGKGWVPMAAAERIGNGEWFEDNKWMTMAEADKLHADTEKPWVVETDNFILRSTDSRKQTIQIAERLEGIRHLCFRQFLEFFLRGSAKKGAEMLFNQSAPKKMLVYFFGTEEEYAQFCTKEMKGRDTSLLLQSAGFYSPSLHNCYFYRGEQPQAFMIPLMQHEVTHQVLGEFATGGNPPVWIAEGIAGVLEFATPDAQRKLTLPSGIDHTEVLHACELLDSGKLCSAGMMMNMSHAIFHSMNRRRNYAESAALCRFLLEMQNGAYSADFLECMSDYYRGVHGGAISLSDYLALDNAEIDKQFRAYLKAQMAKLPAKK